MVIFGYLTHKFRREMMVFAVSLTGMFMIMQGFAIIFGRFPTIFQMMDSMRSGDVSTEVDAFFWLYLVLFGFGTLFFTGFHLRKHKQVNGFLAA